jgi:hypothetical protein
MITNKDNLLENPLNQDLNINDLLLLNLNYKEEKVDDVIQRDTIYLIKKNESIFNKVIKNNCLEDEELFELPESDLYKELILNRNESQEQGEENLDELIKNMTQSNKTIEQKIMKLNKEIFIKKSLLPYDKPEFNISAEDISFINKIEELLGEFVNEKNKNLNL